MAEPAERRRVVRGRNQSSFVARPPVDFKSFLTAIYDRFREANGSEAAAALAYRLAAALFPFLILLAASAAAGLQIFGGDESAKAAIDRIDALLPDRVADGAERQLRSVANTSSIVPLVGGFVATLWTGVTGGQSVVRHLNTIHDLREDRTPVRVAAVALGVSLATSIGAVLALAVLLVGSMDRARVADVLGFGDELGFLIEVARWPLAFAALTGAAAISYALAPARATRLLPITFGSIVFGVLWTVSSGLLALYITNVDAFTRTYGALAGIVALLAWGYVTSLAFIVGAVVDAELEVRHA